MSETKPAVFRPEVVPGERIFLSHPQREDLDQYARWFADLELNTYLGSPGGTVTLEQEREWLDKMLRETGDRHFAIVVREGQRLIGTVSLMDINYRHGHATLGIAIGEKDSWGQGYGTEAVRLIAEYGFVFLSLHHIRLWHVAFNERGHRAYLRAGFREAGRLRGAYLFNGRRYDDVLMEMTRDDVGESRLSELVSLLGR
jgi:RimJ/RimL family protein N-acetyltransferase